MHQNLQIIDRIISEHDLNPVIEKRPALRRAMGMSQPTQWRKEKKVGIEPTFHVGDRAAFDTRDYLARMLGLEGSEAA